MTLTAEIDRVTPRRAPELVLCSELHPASWNPRTITRPRFKALMRSIAADPALLWHRPVLAQERTRDIYAGNMRFLAVQELWKRGAPAPQAPGEQPIDWAANARLAGITKNGVPAVIEDVDDVVARERAIRDNQAAGEWQDEQLAEVLTALRDEDADMSALGLDDEDLARLSLDLPPGAGELPTGEDPGPTEPPVEPVTRPGDLWVLGPHRLLCGDATQAGGYERLLGGRRAGVCITSPPYNVGGNTIPNGLGGGTKKYAGDDDLKDADAYLSLLSAFTTEVLARCDLLALNIQPLAGNKLALIDFLAAFRDRYADMAVWDKQNAQPAMAAGVMNSQFELILFLSGVETNPTRRFPRAVFHGTVSNVYTAPPQRDNAFAGQHAATFPLHLPRWVLAEFAPGDDPVLDPFLGTGTTLIAADQAGRPCVGIEIDPAYCDVAIRRWLRFSGGDAIREDDGASFRDLAGEPEDADGE